MWRDVITPLSRQDGIALKSHSRLMRHRYCLWLVPVRRLLSDPRIRLIEGWLPAVARNISSSPGKKPNAMRCNLAKLTFEYKSKFRSLKAREAIWIIYLRYDKKNQSIQLKENCDVMRFELHSTTHTIASVTQSDCVKVTTTYVILIRNGSAGGETSVVYTCSYSYIVVRCLSHYMYVGDITQFNELFHS